MAQQLSALEKAYLDVVQRLNAAVAKGESLDAASEFAAASSSALQSVPPSNKSACSTMLMKHSPFLACNKWPQTWMLLDWQQSTAD